LIAYLWKKHFYCFRFYYFACSEVEVTDSEKDQRGFYIKKVIGDGNCFFRAVSLDLTGKEIDPLFLSNAFSS
jgi:hypothetical protein